MEDKKTWASTIAGFTAGSSSLILFPLELIKVHMMVSDGHSKNYIPKYNNPLHALKLIYKEQGILGLYRGCHFTLFSSIAWSVYFFFYESAKGHYPDSFKSNYPESYKLAVAIEAAILARLVTNPMWVLKTRVILQRTARHWYGDTMDGIAKIWKLDGIRGFYSGLVPGLVLSFSGALQMYFYETLKDMLSSQSSVYKTSIAGGASKVLATTLLYPAQTVMVRLQQEQYTNYIPKHADEITFKSSEPKLFDGTLNCILKTYQLEGIRGFFRGLSVQLLRQFPGNALFFIIYEGTYKLLAG